MRDIRGIIMQSDKTNSRSDCGNRPFINASAVLAGGVLGALLSQRLPERIRVSMTSIFGLASLGIGILLVIKCANLPVMVLATIIGALIGEFCYLEKGINTAVTKAQQLIKNREESRPRHLYSELCRHYCSFLRQRNRHFRRDA